MNAVVFVISLANRLLAQLSLFFKYNGKTNQEVFSKIYRQRVWGGDHLPFYSGGGSVEAEVVEPYIASVKNFVSGLSNPITAVDLGCGDFRVGSRLVYSFERYTAVDVVEDLIEFNRSHYRDLPVKFELLDLTVGPIPKGDLLMVRQVLQHLSNRDISKFLKLIPNEFRYLVITEHLPTELNFTANLDKKTGPDNRLGIKSGIVLTKEPFNLRVESQEILASEPQAGGVIVTTLYTLLKNDTKPSQ
jgi:hypothetical protein